jgi:hypothetical protein
LDLQGRPKALDKTKVKYEIRKKEIFKPPTIPKRPDGLVKMFNKQVFEWDVESTKLSDAQNVVAYDFKSPDAILAAVKKRMGEDIGIGIVDGQEADASQKAVAPPKPETKKKADESSELTWSQIALDKIEDERNQKGNDASNFNHNDTVDQAAQKLRKVSMASDETTSKDSLLEFASDFQFPELKQLKQTHPKKSIRPAPTSAVEYSVPTSASNSKNGSRWSSMAEFPNYFTAADRRARLEKMTRHTPFGENGTESKKLDLRKRYGSLAAAPF